MDIGLPQFHRMFLDARFDGRMLDSITLEDLNLLDVNVPFHISSIKRALQALRLGSIVSCDYHVTGLCCRMCGYDPEYLKDSCLEKNRGSQKLLHWSSKDVSRWVCSIELDDYVGAMDTAGIHGAVMVSSCVVMREVMIVRDSCSYLMCNSVVRVWLGHSESTSPRHLSGNTFPRSSWN